jgi:hypothetical protein
MKVTRARDYRLYFGDQRSRLLDLALDGGRALFGHSPRGLSKTYKAGISRGLYAPFLSEAHSRACGHLRNRFPDYKVLIFPDRRRTLDFLLRGPGIDVPESAFRRPGGTYGPESSVQIWRPYEAQEACADFLLPIIPQPGNWAPQALLYRRSMDELKSYETCSPLALEGLVHMLELMEVAERYATFGSAAKLDNQPKKHAAALGKTRPHLDESQWARALPAESAARSSTWLRRGPYLSHRDPESIDPEQWHRFTRRGRSHGLLLPGTADSVIIIPAMFSDREERAMHTLFSGGIDE